MKTAIIVHNDNATNATKLKIKCIILLLITYDNNHIANTNILNAI